MGGYPRQMIDFQSRGSRLVAVLSHRLQQIDWRKSYQRLSYFADRLWRWLLRFVLRTSRAFLAGAGALNLLVFGTVRSAGVEWATISISEVLLLSLAGGVIGVVIQRYYERFALLGRLSESLACNVEAVEEAT